MTNILKGILAEILEKVSPEVRKLIKETVLKWKETAAETDNWYDDLLVDFLYDVLGFNEE